MGAASKQRGNIIFAGMAGTIVLGAAALLLSTVSRLRMFELRDSLQAFNEKSDDLRNVTLLSRVSMINQRTLSVGGQGKNAESAAAYKQEAESALIAIKQSRTRGVQVSFTDRAALPVLNGFNALVGIPRMHLGKTPEREIVLDMAFQFETYREYSKAIRGYDVYLNEFSLGPEERDFALLHRGFCRAMLSDFKNSVADFETVATNKESNSAGVAQKLTAFLKALEVRITIIESVKDPALRGEMYYNAAAYMKALENFALAANQNSEKIKFLTARSLEETGRSKEALTIYRELISRPGGSQYAVNANRRMYLLGTFLGNDQNLAQESKKNSETVVKDKEFMASVTHLEKSAVTLHAEVEAERATQSAEFSQAEKLVAPEEPKKQEPAVVTNTMPPATKPEPAAKPSNPPTKLPNPPVVKSTTPVVKPEPPKKQENTIDKLTMSDGNVFFGKISKEDESTVFLSSALGNLELDKSNVLKREKVKGNVAPE